MYLFSFKTKDVNVRAVLSKLKPEDSGLISALAPAKRALDLESQFEHSSGMIHHLCSGLFGPYQLFCFASDSNVIELAFFVCLFSRPLFLTSLYSNLKI